jgi:hypothetical protein
LLLQPPRDEEVVEHMLRDAVRGDWAAGVLRDDVVQVAAEVVDGGTRCFGNRGGVTRSLSGTFVIVVGRMFVRRRGGGGCSSRC